MTRQGRIQRLPKCRGVALERQQSRIAGGVILQPRQYRPSQSGTLLDVGQRQPKSFALFAEPSNCGLDFTAHGQPGLLRDAPVVEDFLALRLDIPPGIGQSLRFVRRQWADHSFGNLFRLAHVCDELTSMGPRSVDRGKAIR